MTDNMIGLVNRLKAIPKGTQLTLILTDIFGAPFDYRATHAGMVEQHGYYCPGGGWGLYQSKGDIECYRVLVKPYRNRRNVWFKIGQKVIDYRLGW